MTLRIEVKRETRTLLRKLEREWGPRAVDAAAFRFLDQRAAVVAGQASRNVSAGKFGVFRRTGSLADSIVGFGDRVRGKPAMRVGVLRGPASAYAGVQELGTKGKNPASPYDTIKPRTARYLAVPVNDALTPSGVPRYRSPRDYDRGELIFFPAKGRALAGILAQAPPKGEPPIASFLLLRYADIAPHFYLRQTVEEALPKLVADLGGALKRQLAAHGGVA